MSKALIRYWAYDRCLQNRGVKYTWIDLQRSANQDLEDRDYLPIGKTQFFKDLKALKAPPWLAPIETYKEGSQSYYRYSDTTYSIRKQELSELEAQQLKSALMVLSRFKGMPQFDWVHEIIPKIEQSFKLDGNKKEILGFEQNIDLKGLEHLGNLFTAILFKRALSIDYKAFTGDLKTQIIHPYFLKQYNNRWFLFGKNPEYTTISNLALDRVEEVSVVQQPYIENSDYNFDEYFEDIIGVTKPIGKEVENVKLWFSPSQAPYILTKPLHGTQKRKIHDATGLTITISVIPNIELEQLVLRHGENCQVLEPKHLRERIEDRLRQALTGYNTIPNNLKE
jgi:predicted DNA-binding transcriptional regulator YafY